jgi:hypothetical protein
MFFTAIILNLFGNQIKTYTPFMNRPWDIWGGTFGTLVLQVVKESQLLTGLQEGFPIKESEVSLAKKPILKELEPDVSSLSAHHVDLGLNGPKLVHVVLHVQNSSQLSKDLSTEQQRDVLFDCANPHHKTACRILQLHRNQNGKLGDHTRTIAKLEGLMVFTHVVWYSRSIHLRQGIFDPHFTSNGSGAASVGQSHGVACPSKSLSTGHQANHVDQERILGI